MSSPTDLVLDLLISRISSRYVLLAMSGFPLQSLADALAYGTKYLIKTHLAPTQPYLSSQTGQHDLDGRTTLPQASQCSGFRLAAAAFC